MRVCVTQLNYFLLLSFYYSVTVTAIAQKSPARPDQVKIHPIRDETEIFKKKWPWKWSWDQDQSGTLQLEDKGCVQTSRPLLPTWLSRWFIKSAACQSVWGQKINAPVVSISCTLCLPSMQITISNNNKSVRWISPPPRRLPPVVACVLHSAQFLSVAVLSFSHCLFPSCVDHHHHHHRHHHPPPRMVTTAAL